MRALRKIVAGGQTGVDRAALDFALANGIAHGGWCPHGRRAEDGAIPPAYHLEETPQATYEQRTEWNVRDSDATVVFSASETISGGTAFTASCARRQRKPLLHLTSAASVGAAARALARFVTEHQVAVLNVAGPRASEEPATAAHARRVLQRALAL
jgi:hypothetical protein